LPTCLHHSLLLYYNMPLIYSAYILPTVGLTSSLISAVFMLR
jgi:hypothetical protein